MAAITLVRVGKNLVLKMGDEEYDLNLRLKGKKHALDKREKKELQIAVQMWFKAFKECPFIVADKIRIDFNNRYEVEGLNFDDEDHEEVSVERADLHKLAKDTHRTSSGYFSRKLEARTSKLELAVCQVLELDPSERVPYEKSDDEEEEEEHFRPFGPVDYASAVARSRGDEDVDDEGDELDPHGPIDYSEAVTGRRRSRPPEERADGSVDYRDAVAMSGSPVDPRRPDEPEDVEDDAEALEELRAFADTQGLTPQDIQRNVSVALEGPHRGLFSQDENFELVQGAWIKANRRCKWRQIAEMLMNERYEFRMHEITRLGHLRREGAALSPADKDLIVRALSCVTRLGNPDPRSLITLYSIYHSQT